MSQHTPGPWKVKQGTDVTEDRAKEPCTVAKCWSSTFSPPREEAAANARLIAAAPDLLAACKRGLAALTVAVEVGGGDPAEHECCRQMGLAIAKAEGGAA